MAARLIKYVLCKNGKVSNELEVDLSWSQYLRLSRFQVREDRPAHTRKTLHIAPALHG